ncbi:hypothetical protein DSM25558_4334 [Agrobacterium sp. DSM 25558]|nr:hypothetical protein DSM25558_4334 [Agrobacterium sp. DSM 25558]
MTTSEQKFNAIFDCIKLFHYLKLTQLTRSGTTVGGKRDVLAVQQWKPFEENELCLLLVARFGR